MSLDHPEPSLDIWSQPSSSSWDILSQFWEKKLLDLLEPEESETKPGALEPDGEEERGQGHQINNLKSYQVNY